MTWFRRVPFTITFLVLLWTVGVLTGSVAAGPPSELLDHFGLGYGSLAAGHWWSPVSSMVWAGDLPSYVGASVVVGVLCGTAEHRIGTARVTLLFLVTQVAGALAAMGAIAAGTRLGNAWAEDLSSATVVTPTAAAMGVAVAATWRLEPLWRRRVRFALLLGVVLFALYSGFTQDLVRLFAALAGLGLGRVVLGRATVPAQPVRSRTETRLVVAMVVAASAAGPLVATATQTAEGPLSVLQFLVTAPAPDPSMVSLACTEANSILDCRQLRATLRLSGVGPAFLSILPVLLMLVMAEGLRRGRAFAWWGALVLNLSLTVLGGFLFRSYLDYGTEDGGAPVRMTLHDWLETSVPLLQPILVVAVLVATRRWFRVSAPRGTYARFGAVLGGTFVVSSAAYVAGVYATGAAFDPKPSFGQLLLDLPMRYLPPGYLGAFPVRFVPVDGAALALYRWTGPVFWGVALLGCLATFLHARIARRESDRARARSLLRQFGGDTMSHMITWRGNDYWFDDRLRVVIAYRVISSVAVTTSGPVGPPHAREAATARFVEFCAENGWTPCFYAVTDGTGTQLAGWKAAQVAEEAIVPLARLEFRGKKWQDVRSALNKARGLGVTAEFVDYPGDDPRLRAQLEAVSRAWVAGKGMPEMGFTLGTLRELADPDVRCLVAVDGSGTVHGLTSWLPVYRDGQPVAWTLDVMRRAPQAFAGVMEFLIASMALRAQEEHAEFLSLSGAPLASRNSDGPDGGLEKLLELTGRAIEPIYGFRSLLAFKAKFQPEYRPLFLTYPATTALPGIGNAIVRAYLPHATFTQYLRLFRRLARRNRAGS